MAHQKNIEPRVFISHAWENKLVVRQLEERLRAAGAEVWVDHVGIRGGDSLPKRISEALEWCNTLVLVWSKASSASEWVAMEWENAISLKKRIIPCLLDETRLPGILSRMAYVGLQNTEQGITTLLHAFGLSERPIVDVPRVANANVLLRAKPLSGFSEDAVKAMLKEKDFFDSLWHKEGKGLRHQYEVVERHGGKLVIDHATGLMWQQSGSPSGRKYSEAALYISVLNYDGFAGYDDWRLPTLEEGMSLMETERKSNGLYIDLIFDVKQSWIWTADEQASGVAWSVNIIDGYCFIIHVAEYTNVRAVRFGQ